MTAQRTYLDWNASAPIFPEVVTAMADGLLSAGNASSVHQEGRCARNKIERAREQVAGLVNALPRDVIFTSGGSEANALALGGLAATGAVNRFMISKVEHPSVLAAAQIDGVGTTLLDVDENGVIVLDKLGEELARATSQGERVLVSVMAANNETGVIQPLEEIIKLAHANAALVHCDAVQTAGKIPVEFSASGLDMMSLSAHKIGGPQGAGALIANARVVLAPMISGGGQELNRRAGTENLSGIVGFGLAAKLSSADARGDQILALRQEFESKIKSITSDAVIFGEACQRLPNTTCMAVGGTAAETLLIALDLAGIAVSSGAACSSGKVANSHVLAAMGVEQSLGKAAIRVSLGRTTTREDIEKFITSWVQVLRAAPGAKITAAA